jgi:thiamine-monophosphate kinase
LRLSEAGEFGLLRELERQGLVDGLDAEGAVLADGFVVTQDTLVEDVHFRLRWTSWRDLGYKATAVNLSDLAALGAEPEALLVSVALPPTTAVDDVLELYGGLNEPGVAVRGGDTARSSRAMVSVTALGRSDRVPGRAGARPGDALVVTGPLGAAAAGLEVLRRGLPGFEELVERHRRPPLRLEEGRRLARVAHAVVDVSDGIPADAARIAERYGCRLVVEVERLPLAPRLDELGDASLLALGGEDYELLAALTADDARASGFPLVGWCEEGAGAELRRHGEPLTAAGWDAFRESPGPKG